ncbi:DUF2267 domain-containing protein [Streptomyces sp. B1866]|uniref:DUF2267 domain-containing protein n=1 Tax=Streptomyces sp. B1866 TaxID=3075431 RepID=UPI00288D5969|nr:DUF2267 domain-containing protein [Streptomyces sp. B1866]MDT3397124.1 DUF2267 domain-containing protein [Streptomyces sp. B1866]
MSYGDFLAAVRDRGGYDPDEAQRVTEAVITTLGERLAPEPAGHLADQLPAPLAEKINDAEAAPHTWGVREFVSRVADATGADEQAAEGHARAVLSTLADQVTGGETNKLISQLPSAYAELFGHPELA